MTPKQRKFALNFVKSENAHQSAIEAGYSTQYARSNSRKLLDIPDVIAEIKRLRARMNQQADKSAIDVVNEFSKIAFSDRIGFLKPDPLRDGEFMYKSPDELTSDQRQIIETTKLYTTKIVVVDEDGKAEPIWRQEYSYVFADKARALEQMGRHFGIFDDKIKLGVSAVNPFANASQKQLDALKASFIQTMNDPKLITDVEFEEVSSGK